MDIFTIATWALVGIIGFILILTAILSLTKLVKSKGKKTKNDIVLNSKSDEAEKPSDIENAKTNKEEK